MIDFKCYISLIEMERLHEYRKMLKISCLSISEGKNANNFTFEVKFEQLQPHNVFKYTVLKHREEVMLLYQRLQLCIFDLNTPFNNSLVSLVHNQLEIINQSLKECTQRIDVLTNHHFIAFFSIHLHYDDFITCLKQEEHNKQKSEEKQGKMETLGLKSNTFYTEKPWIKSQKNLEGQKPLLKAEENERMKKQKQTSLFERMINLVNFEKQCDLELQQTQVLDFTFVRYYQNQLLYVLQQPKKGTKIKNFFKNMFSQSTSQMGFLSIHRCTQSKYKKMQSTELLAEPLSMTFNDKTNMVFVCTGVGVYIYLSKVQKKLEQIQIFAYVELARTIDFAANTSKAQLYLLSEGERHQLHVYSINREELKKTQYRYKKASAICYEQNNSRLFVGENDSIHIYSVIDFLEIKKLHQVKVELMYQRLIENHGYLFCLSQKGLMTVIELKPPGKEKLISVTTSIDLPEGSTQLVGSLKNKRLIITVYRNCVVLIDTMEGPFSSVKLNIEQKVQAVYSDRQKGEVLALSVEGHLTTLRLNQTIR